MKEFFSKGTKSGSTSRFALATAASVGLNAGVQALGTTLVKINNGMPKLYGSPTRAAEFGATGGVFLGALYLGVWYLFTNNTRKEDAASWLIMLGINLIAAYIGFGILGNDADDNTEQFTRAGVLLESLTGGFILNTTAALLFFVGRCIYNEPTNQNDYTPLYDPPQTL